MDKEPIFVDGVVFQDPHEKAPAFVKFELVINAEKFNEFMKANMQYASAKGWLTIVAKESKKGGIYFQLDTYKPAQSNRVESTSTMTSVQPDGSPAIDMSESPF